MSNIVIMNVILLVFIIQHFGSITYWNEDRAKISNDMLRVIVKKDPGITANLRIPTIYLFNKSVNYINYIIFFCFFFIHWTHFY